MSFTYIPQKSKYRVTLEIDAMDDFNPHQIDWEIKSVLFNNCTFIGDVQAKMIQMLSQSSLFDNLVEMQIESLTTDTK